MEYLDLIDVNDEQKVTVEIVEQIGDVCRMRLTSSDRMVWSFGLPQSQRQLGEEITLTVREIKKYVRNYLRPPAKLYLRDYWKNSRSDWLRKLAHSRPFLLPKNAILRRGNSAIFRCPIHDCGAIADADIQAAINIALRGIFEDKNSSDATKSKGEKSNFSKFLKFIKSIQLLPDENSGFRDLNDVLINKSYFTGHVEW